MDVVFFILPNQLFELRHLQDAFETLTGKHTTTDPIESKIHVVLWEHPHFFTKYKFNKKKLVLHRSSMRHYYDTVLEPLEKKGDLHELTYIEFHDKSSGEDLLKSRRKKQGRVTTAVVAFDPIDDIRGFNRKITTLLESPNFLLSKQDYVDYRKGRDADKGFAFTNGFYPYGKKVIKHLEDVKSTDHSNRGKLNTAEGVPDPPSVEDIHRKEKGYIKEAGEYVDRHFPKNYGTTEGFNFPISHETAREWLRDFVKGRFELFGKYQDAIVKDNYALYHSLLSSSLNVGLLNPCDVIDYIKSLNPRTNGRSPVPINSYEGFVRQLFWREYQRYCYIHAYDLIKNTNFFGNRRRVTKKWYDGTTGAEPVDNCIKRAFDSAYLHHIERLMVVGNYMMLNKISPSQGYKWFMEFSIDSYNWVMHQNVYDMVFFNSGGVTMRKPYISSSAYVLKMSNYRKGKGDDWATKWDKLYKEFLEGHEAKLQPFLYHFPSLRRSK